MNSPAIADRASAPILCRDGEDLTLRATIRIASALDEAVDRRGRALMALSGGSTPRPVYQRLGHCVLPWPQVTTTLVDERWVPSTSPDSNARMIQATLRAGPAAAGDFLTFWRDGATPEQAAAQIDQGLGALNAPFDVVMLGMGEDGHTASLFPGAPELAVGLDPASPVRCLAVRPHDPAPLQTRITLSLSAILNARLIVLLITGAAKLKVLEAAIAMPPERAPIGAVLRQTSTPVDIYWAP